MTAKLIGFLHPGAMGSSIAATAQRSGHEVYWASEGRSQGTRERATRQGLRDARHARRALRDMLDHCEHLPATRGRIGRERGGGQRL